MQIGKRSREALLVFFSAIVFGLCVVLAIPILTKNPLFLVGLPVAGIALIFMVLNFRWMLLIILMTRALLDPLLEKTKIGEGSGLGGLLNLFLILMVLLMATRFPAKLKRCRFLLPWSVFLTVCLVAVKASPLPTQSIRLFLNLTTYLCMFIAPYLVLENRKEIASWLKILLVSSLLPTVLAFVGIFVKLKTFYAFDRLAGTFSHSNILAFYMVLMIAVVFLVMKTRVPRPSPAMKFAMTMLILTMTAVLVVTQTRSAWISCAVFFLLYGFLREKKYLLILVLGALLALAVPQVQTRLADLGSGTGSRQGEKLNSMAWRVRLWESAVPEILKRPVLGYGLGTFQFYSKDFFELEKKNGAPAHNVYVELLFETGVVGLLSYLMIYFSMLGGLAKEVRRRTGPLSTESLVLSIYIVGYMLVSVSDNALYYLAFNWYFWFFAGLVLCGLELESEESTVRVAPSEAA